jgi:hypothetical protein
MAMIIGGVVSAVSFVVAQTVAQKIMDPDAEARRIA